MQECKVHTPPLTTVDQSLNLQLVPQYLTFPTWSLSSPFHTWDVTHHFCKSSDPCDFAKKQPMNRRVSSLKAIDDKAFGYWSKMFSKVLCHFEKYVPEWMRPSLNKDSKFKVLYFIQNCLSAHGSCDFKWDLLASLVMFACCYKPPICKQ